ncbi:hypothetical protein B566_EDAN001152 [Ephemera danica]|nr:hypothetical protein B566_EDAN001152 [Ephemera danica]
MFMSMTDRVCLLALLCVLCVPNEAQTQDSSILVRLAGATSEMFNSLIDNVWRRPFLQTGRSNLESTLVYNAQRSMSDDEAFMCDTSKARSPEPPTTVHQLRAGDIDVIAAMGDSLSSGNGPMAPDVARLILNHRGGQANWRKYLTLPNIIKEFNPNLIGYSTGDGYSYSKNAGFNVAVTGAITPDLPHQARILVRRWRNDPRVNMTHHWKLVTILIGSNDICIFACYDPNEYSGMRHGKHLMEALDYLYKNVPRLFVNLVMQPELAVLRGMPTTSLVCHLAHHLECPCMFGAYADTKAVLADKLVAEYRQQERALVWSGRYDGRKDFTIEMQPFTEYAMNDEMKSQQEMDMKLFAVDCFHLSQKGNAYAANALWNNMLEPDGNKSTTWQPEFERVLCPSINAPYLFTRENSKQFLTTGKQYVPKS